MASKTKKRKLKEQRNQNNNLIIILISIFMGILALLQNKYGQFSDIRGFYGMHFSDGQHHWPFSSHKLTGSNEPMHPVEYPALTGLIMWLISFFVPTSNTAVINYYQITAVFQIVIFGLTTYIISKLTKKKYAIYFAISPAVLYSLNRNWDIWAIITLIWAVTLFEKHQYKKSAILLAFSIATKFFPVVLLMPIAVELIRKKKLKVYLQYLSLALLTWLLINAPFMLINFKGWSYFYEFSFNRGLGSASIFELANIFGIDFLNKNSIYYLLNISIMLVLFLYFWNSKNIVSLRLSSFLTMFAFMLFNKQYSMQYVIWLTALAVIAMSLISSSNRLKTLVFFSLWQISELLFQYSFFQHILTSTFANTDTPVNPEISEFTYANFGLMRYLFIIIFAIILILFSRSNLDNFAKNPVLAKREHN